MQPLVIGGPDDGEALERVMRTADDRVISARHQDIVQTFGLIESCTAFLSNDSGLMHLASALNVPTLALFGPSDPIKNRPLGRHTTIHRLALDCSPCNREIATLECQHHNCLETLGVAEVMRVLRRILEDTGRVVSDPFRTAQS
jgi:heptosyltransferase-2